MKARHFLILSVALNLALAAFAVFGFRHTPATPMTVAEPAPSAPVAVVKTNTHTREVTESNQVVALTWQSIGAKDYKAYVANLRAVACPEETLRDIIIADINKLFARRWRDANPTRDYKYWRYGRSSGEDPVREIANRKKLLDSLLREKRELVRSLVGVDLAEDGERYADPSFRGSSSDLQIFDFLPPEKRQLPRQIMDAYDTAVQRILDTRDPDGYLPPDSRKTLTDLRKQAEVDLHRALTPEEWEQFQVRFSNTAQSMRFDLAGFDPSEDEFRRIYGLRKALDEQFENFDPNNKDVQRRRAEANQKLDEDLKNVLTPERYAEYKLSQDAAYKQALAFARAWDLPKESATAVYSIRKAAEQQIAAIQSVAAEDRQAAAVALRAQIESSLRETLGDKAFKSYQRSQSWLRALGQ